MVQKVPRLPRKSRLGCRKCHACHAKDRGATSVLLRRQASADLYLLLLFWCPGALLFFLKHAYHCISRNGNKYQIIACHFISLLLGGNGNKNKNLALASDCFFMPGSTSCQTRNTNCSRWYLANVKAMVLFVDGGIYIYINIYYRNILIFLYFFIIYLYVYFFIVCIYSYVYLILYILRLNILLLIFIL